MILQLHQTGIATTVFFQRKIHLVLEKGTSKILSKKKKKNPLSATEERKNLVYWSGKELLECIKRSGFGKNENNSINVESTDKSLCKKFI